MTQILIIEDEPRYRQAFQLNLEEAGYEVQTVSAVPDVGELLAEQAYDVILADADLLAADASKASAQRVRHLGEEIPLILTPSEEGGIAAQVSRLCGYDWIAKDASSEQLTQLVRRAVERRHLLLERRLLIAERSAYQEDLDREVAARLADTEESAQELKTLTRIGREISGTLDLSHVLKRVAQLAAEVCGAYRCTIVLVGDNGEMLIPAMSAFSDGHVEKDLWHIFKDKAYPVSLAEAPEAQDVVRHQEPLFIADAESSSLPEHLITPFDVKSVLLVPLVSKKWVVGLMALDHIEEDRRFTARQVDMASSIAAQATLAIENARLYEQTHRRARHSELINMVAQQANSIIESDRLLPIVASTIHKHFGYDSIMIMLMDEKGEALVVGGKAGVGADLVPDDYRQSMTQGMMGWVARQGDYLVSNNVQREERYIAPFSEHYHAQSELTVPLKIEGEVVGVLDLQSQQRERFDELDIATACTLAEQIATALQNLRLYSEAQRHVEELTALHNIDLAITSTLSLDEVLERVYEQVTQLMDMTTFYIGLYEERKDQLRISLIIDQGSPREPMTLDLQGESGFAGWVARNRKPLWINDWEEEQDGLPVRGISRGKPTLSLMVLPLLARDELVGVMSVQSYETHAFDVDHHRLFNAIANQVAIAVHNARLFEETNRRLREMRLLQRVINAASSTLEFDEVLARTMTTLHDTLDIEHLAFAVPNEDESALMVHPSPLDDEKKTQGPKQLPMGESIMGRVYRTGEAFLFTDVGDVSSSLDGTPATRTELAVPIRDGEQVIAVLNAESPILEDFDEDDLSLFSAVAAQLGVALKNVHLFEEMERRLTETRLLQRVMQAGAISLDFDGVLEQTVAALHDALGIDHLAFALPVDDGTALQVHPSQIGYPPEVTELRIPLHRSVAGRAFLTGDAQLVDDVRETPIYYAGAPDVLSELNVPVQIAGRVVAVLSAESSIRGAFDDEDLQLFEAVAAQLGIVLENARLYRRLQDQRDMLSEAYEELKEIDRLRAELVQNLSHELRTPFTLVQGYIELLKAGDLGPLNEKQQEALQIIHGRVDALEHRTHDLTTLDGLSRGQATSSPTNVLQGVRSAMADLRDLANQAGICISEEMPESLPPVTANGAHLEQAFTHLIDNAIKFSPDGGTVTIRAWAEDGQSCVAVHDQGIGIEAEHLNHIFKRFYQVDGSINRRFGGMGIGLALVWEIVEVYGGTVEVSSSPEEGSTFVVSLPQARSEVSDPEVCGTHSRKQEGAR